MMVCLCQEPTGDGRVQNKFTGLLPYACHKFLCAYAGLSLRARSHGLPPATTSTTHASFIGNKRKIEPIQFYVLDNDFTVSKTFFPFCLFSVCCGQSRCRCRKGFRIKVGH